jgi:hypothetical protein
MSIQVALTARWIDISEDLRHRAAHASGAGERGVGDLEPLEVLELG